jgi:hypothetical protein
MARQDQSLCPFYPQELNELLSSSNRSGSIFRNTGDGYAIRRENRVPPEPLKPSGFRVLVAAGKAAEK